MIRLFMFGPSRGSKGDRDKRTIKHLAMNK